MQTEYEYSVSPRRVDGLGTTRSRVGVCGCSSGSRVFGRGADSSRMMEYLSPGAPEQTERADKTDGTGSSPVPHRRVGTSLQARLDSFIPGWGTEKDRTK